MNELAEYKRYIREIKHKKGTVAWLKEFVKWVNGSGYVVKLLKFYKLTPQEFIHLKIIIQQLEKNEACEFIEQGLSDFLRENGFPVELVGIGYTVMETT